MIVMCSAKNCKWYDGGCFLTMIELDDEGNCKQADFTTSDHWNIFGDDDVERQLDSLMKDGGVR